MIADDEMRKRLALLASGDRVWGLDSEADRAAIKWALDRLKKLEVVSDALLEHENALGEIPCPGRKGTTMRCMPGDKCSFCRSRDLVKRCENVMEG
jgi:hypothetical protein